MIFKYNHVCVDIHLENIHFLAGINYPWMACINFTFLNTFIFPCLTSQSWKFCYWHYLKKVLHILWLHLSNEPPCCSRHAFLIGSQSIICSCTLPLLLLGFMEISTCQILYGFSNFCISRLPWKPPSPQLSRRLCIFRINDEMKNAFLSKFSLP